MRSRVPDHAWRSPLRVAGMLLAASLVLAVGVPAALAATPPPPPEIERIDVLKNGDLNIVFHSPQILVPIPNSNGGVRSVKPDSPWGFRFNAYIEQTGERVATETWVPSSPEEYNAFTRSYHPASATFFNHRGTANDNRYCITMQAYAGDGTDAGSQFSAEGNRKCAGTQAVLIVTQSTGPSPFGNPTPPPPTKPDLAVTRVTGPDQLFDGTTAVYEVFLWNDGTPAQGTAQILIGLLGNIVPVDLVEVPDGFTCDLGQYGYSCLGSLGGVDDALQTRGALFKVQGRGNGPGSAAVYGSANHDRSLDEMTVDNNLKLLSVTVI